MLFHNTKTLYTLIVYVRSLKLTLTFSWRRKKFSPCSGYFNLLNMPRTNAGPENSCGILLAPYASGRHKKVRNSRVWPFPIEGSDTRRFLEGPAQNSKVPQRPRANGDFVCLDLRQGRSPRAKARNQPWLLLGRRSLAARQEIASFFEWTVQPSQL